MSLVGAGTESAERKLLSLPVTVDRDVPAVSIIVLDKKAVPSVIGNVQVASSQDFLFDKDSIAVRATVRFGAKIADADRVVLLGVDGSA